MTPEDTRNDFEAAMHKIAIERDYVYHDLLFERCSDDGDYRTSWVDCAWLGWCAAIEETAK